MKVLVACEESQEVCKAFQIICIKAALYNYTRSAFAFVARKCRIFFFTVNFSFQIIPSRAKVLYG